MNPLLKKIDYFLAENFDHSMEGTEKANNTLTNIILAAAKVSLPTKKQKRFKTKKPKKWFDKDCNEARKQFTRASNKSSEYPSDTSFIQEKNSKLKSLKKICKLQQRTFWDKCNDDLEANQHSNVWNAWQKM